MELIGQRFGHIRVTEVVGQGGMGDVYAGYDEKLERKVAVKVLNADQRLDLEAKERLLREARALSRLDHPNICRIHDYIESGDVDLLVLEYIDGRTLGDLMTEHLSRGERLRIAMAIASVLVAAHRAGIVHRDLKPDNVMLTKGGEVKVLDFGLARWLQRTRGRASSGSHTAVKMGAGGRGDTLPLPTFEPLPLATAAGITLGTPLYMSPEQARGETLTPASDMFSFGLLLQALFTGMDPHPMGLSAREVIVRVARGETSPVNGVPGDITALIHRLKQFASTDRPTAVETLERLRYLAEKPRRIARRAIAAAIVFIAAFAAWRYTVDLRHEREEAQRRRAQAENFMEFMLGDLRKKLEPVGRLDILDDVGARALQYVDSLRPEDMNAEELVRNAKALNQLGEVRIAQGKLDEAMQIFQRSVKLSGAAIVRDPKNDRARMMLGTSHFWVGDVYRQQSRLPEALREYGQYMAIGESLAGRHPTNDEYRLERAYGHSVVATIYEREGQYARALEHLKLTREVKEARLAAVPRDPDRQADLALTVNRIGFVLERSGDLRGAREHYERELGIYSRLAAADPRNSYWQDRLVTSHNFIARALEMTGDLDGALAHRKEEVAAISGLHAHDPANAKWQRNLAISRMNYGSTLRMRGHLEEARTEITAAAQLLDPLLDRKETMSSWRRDRATIHAANARLQLALGDRKGAEQSARAALDGLSGLPTNDAKVVQFLGASQLVLGDARAALGNMADAREAWEQSVALLRPAATKNDTPAVLDVLAQALLRLGAAAEAQPYIDRLTSIGYRAPDFVGAMAGNKRGERS
jgi:serine/threonine-protein kinase